MKPGRPDPERFAELQGKAREAERVRWEYGHALDYRYQDRAYAPAAKRHKFEVLERAAKRTADRYFAYLEAISPRTWDHGIPYAWIRDELTYADAVTRDALSVIPRPAYGYTPADILRYIGPVREEQST